MLHSLDGNAVLSLLPRVMADFDERIQRSRYAKRNPTASRAMNPEMTPVSYEGKAKRAKPSAGVRPNSGRTNECHSLNMLNQHWWANEISALGVVRKTATA
jgi:hypothetical protein